MVGLGKVKGNEISLEHAVREKKKYQYLVDDAGAWTERKDVRFVRYMSGNGPLNNEWMTVKGNTLGPEFGIGHPLGNAIDAPVMILKCCIGNRSLGWDLAPPGSERFEFVIKDKAGAEKTMVYAGYKDKPNSWEMDPARYEENLVRFIQQLRTEFNAPNAKFVLATMGESVKGGTGPGAQVLEGHLAVDGSNGKYPEFKGNVATIYTNPMAQGGSGNGHYGGKAEVYMDVGEAMGQAMVELLKEPK